MMSGMPLETGWAVNERWNNKFYYKVASCWLFLLSETLHVSDSSSVRHQDFFTVHIAKVYVIQVCWQLFAAVSKTVWHIPWLCVHWKTPDDGQRNCSKHVEFHSKNKFKEMVYLVGFIVRNLTQRTVTWSSNETYMCHCKIMFLFL